LKINLDKSAYETPSAFRFQVVLKDDNHLYLETPGQPLSQLIPYKRHKFRRKEFSDLYYEFVLKEGQVTAMKVITPSGQYENIRK
jgi:hypothetical protein